MNLVIFLCHGSRRRLILLKSADLNIFTSLTKEKVKEAGGKDAPCEQLMTEKWLFLCAHVLLN